MGTKNSKVEVVSVSIVHLIDMNTRGPLQVCNQWYNIIVVYKEVL